MNCSSDVGNYPGDELSDFNDSKVEHIDNEEEYDGSMESSEHDGIGFINNNESTSDQTI